MFNKRASDHMTWFLHIKHLSGANGIRTWHIEVKFMYSIYTVYLYIFGIFSILLATKGSDD